MNIIEEHGKLLAWHLVEIKKYFKPDANPRMTLIIMNDPLSKKHDSTLMITESSSAEIIEAIEYLENNGMTHDTKGIRL